MVATLTLPLGFSGAYLNGVQITGATQRVTLDNSGSFLMQLADNSLVQCSNPQGNLVTCVPLTQWTFSITESPGVAPPIGTGPQVCTATLTITGAQQIVSIATCPALVTPGVGIGASDPSFVGTVLPSVGGAPQIFQGFSNNNSASASSNTLTLPNATTQGHTYLVNTLQSNTVSVSSVTTTQGDTCTQVGASIAVNTKTAAMFSCQNVAGGASTTITVNYSAAVSFGGILVVELGASSIDASASATGTGTSMASGNLTTVNTEDLLLGISDGFGVSGAAPNVPATNFVIVYGLNGQGQSGSGTQTTGQGEENLTVFATGTYNITETQGLSQSWGFFGLAMKGTPATPVLANASGSGPFNLGTITGPLTPVQFKISGGQITAGQGQFNITITSGACSNCSYALTSSNDNGNTWSTVPCNANTPNNLSSSGDAVPLFSAKCSLVGLMGETGTSFRFGVYQGFGISNLIVWGSI